MNEQEARKAAEQHCVEHLDGDCCEIAQYMWHAALAWLRSQGGPVIKYVGVDAREDVHGLHPNDKEPRDDGLCEEFRKMGDDVGQGLSLYWKWAFASGWNAHKLHATPQPAIPDGWQPIETAPKDELILVSPTKRMGVCVAINHSRDGWVTETPSEWVSIYTPTHWMPIPPEPRK